MNATKINLSNRPNTVRENHTNVETSATNDHGSFKLTGTVSWADLPCWWVDQIVPGKGARTRKVGLGQIFHDEATNEWFACPKGTRRDESTPCDARDAALAFMVESTN